MVTYLQLEDVVDTVKLSLIPWKSIVSSMNPNYAQGIGGCGIAKLPEKFEYGSSGARTVIKYLAVNSSKLSSWCPEPPVASCPSLSADLLTLVLN